MFSLDRNYIKNISWQGTGNIIAQLINIISLPLITRLYTPEDFGILKIFIESLALFTILISFRVDQVVMLPKKNQHAIELFELVFSVGIISLVSLTILIFILSSKGLIPSNFIIWAMIIPITAFLLVISQAAQQLSQRTANFKRSGASEVINRSANGITAIGSGLLGLPGYVLAISVATGFFFKGIIFFKEIRKLNLALKDKILVGIRRIRKEDLERPLASLIFSNILLSITSITPLWYISVRWGNEYLGYFSLVLGTLVLPTTLLGRAVSQVFYQRASSTFSMGNDFKVLLLSNLKLLVLVAIPGFAIVYFFAPFLYPFIFGNKWLIAGEIAQYYVFAAAVGFISIPFERSALIVKAWWYSPIWYIARVFSTILVIYMIDSVEGTFYQFMLWLALQVGIMHLIDIIASYIFSSRTSPFPTRLLNRAN